ncbi:glucose dehydrogenase [FAD, quinone]-like [Bemisia tabaci]|uniref:glucose dehydrogenase [FAD, quinone]-like n=1 Tax=Bemisia tabaci TaxID=7038 RepID=UPI003B27C97E
MAITPLLSHLSLVPLGRNTSKCSFFYQVKKYFLKSEDNSNPELLKTPYHAAGGYLSVQDAPFISQLAEVFLEAGRHLGYGVVDINGRNQTGFSVPQGTIRNGSRCSVAKAFLLPVRERPNLSVSMNSRVTRIGFDHRESTPRARSVFFVKDNKKHLVKSRKEIVLSAGTIGSPQILMLSGVGPKEHLKGLGIKMVKDLPVGDNLQLILALAIRVVELARSGKAPASGTVNPTTLMLTVSAAARGMIDPTSVTADLTIPLA